MKDIFAFLSIVSVVLVILFGAYFTTRQIALRMGANQVFSHGKQKLAMVYRLPLGRDQQLAVVKLLDRHLLIGCTPSAITLLTELSPEESEQFSKENLGADLEKQLPSFGKMMQNFKGGKELQQDDTSEDKKD